MMGPKTPSGMNETAHAEERDPSGAAHATNFNDPSEEIAHTQESTERNKYEALLRSMCKDEKYRLSIFPKILNTLGKGGKLTYEIGKSMLTNSKDFLKQVLPHYFTDGKGVIGEFFNEIKGHFNTFVKEPISNLIKSRAKIQELFGNLKPGDLTDFESKSLYESVSKHQDTCLKYPNETLDHVDKRYESCKAARDRVKSLIDKYETKFAKSHLLSGLYKVYHEEFLVLEKNRENLQDRKKIWDKSIERKSTIESSRNSVREYNDNWNTETDQPKKDKIRDAQHKFLTQTYEPQYNLLKDSIEKQIQFLLSAKERKKKGSPVSYHSGIEANYVHEIIRIRESLKPYMADLDIDTEKDVTLHYLDTDGKPLSFTVVAVTLTTADKTSSLRIP